MKRSIQLIGLSLLIGGLSLNAQDKIQPCDTYKAMEEYFTLNPEAKIKYEAEQDNLRSAYLEFEKNKALGKTAAFEYTVPVVFHILHLGGSENISDATCINALAQVNKDFSKTGSDVATIHATYEPLYINSDIKFMLAKKDPNGNCTTGIVHHYDSKTNWDRSSATNFGINNYVYTWDRTKYLNVYVVKDIVSTGGPGTTVGYTYKPGSSPGANADAIVYNYSFLTGTAARALSHEIGHWLNLSHTWGNTNNAGVSCGDDGITDTPPTKGYFSTCPGGNAGPFSGCSASENIENIMDYSDCPKMFSTGQTNAMRTALASSTAGRNNLWSSTNLTFTDINGTGTNCPPVADLYTPTFTICSGSSHNWYDISYNITSTNPITSRLWAASGGAAVANPTATSTGIVFPTSGLHTVSLTVTNVNGTSTSVRSINVLDGTPHFGINTHYEGFEPSGALPANWKVLSPTGGVTWASSTNPATGVYSYFMENYGNNPNGAVDILETPSYDFANSPGAVFSFKYAYAKKDAANLDVFKVQASADCGGTWADIYVPSNATMASGSGGTTSLPFYPTPTQFKTYSVTSHPAFSTYKIKPNVRIRFYFQEDATNGFGNNFFLDDINFESPAGINEITKSIGFTVYPNPSSGSANMEFTLSENAAVKYSVRDIAGRIVEAEKILNLAPGQHTMLLNKNQNLSAGMYIINFEFNGQKIARKLIIE